MKIFLQVAGSNDGPAADAGELVERAIARYGVVDKSRPRRVLVVGRYIQVVMRPYHDARAAVILNTLSCGYLAAVGA